MKADAMTMPRESAKPWYREPWPWLLMAGPAVVVVAALVTAYIAWSTDDGVVADDYYKRGLVINRVIEREERAAQLALAADVVIDEDGGVRVGVAANAAVEPNSLTLKITNATRAGLDRSTSLVRGADGAWRGRVAPPPAGRWLIVLEGDTWRLPTVEVAGTPRHVRLGAAR